MRKRLLPGIFLTVWRGISPSGVTGSSRFEGIFLEPAYLNTLRTFTVPAVGQQHEDEEFYFHQDEQPNLIIDTSLKIFQAVGRAMKKCWILPTLSCFNCS